MPEQQVMSYLTGLAGLVVLWLIVLIATGKNLWALIMGEDGRPSTSKFQMLVWTAAVVFAFLAIFQIRFSSGYLKVLPDVPTNLLIAMGISVATTVSAKSIAVSYQAKSDAAAAAATTAGVPLAPPKPGLSGIFAGFRLAGFGKGTGCVVDLNRCRSLFVQGLRAHKLSLLPCLRP